MVRPLGSKSGLVRLGITVLILSLGRVPVLKSDSDGFKPFGAPETFAPKNDHRTSHYPEQASKRRPVLHRHRVVLNKSSLSGPAKKIVKKPVDSRPDWCSCKHHASPQFLTRKPPRRFGNPFSIQLREELPAFPTGRLWTLARSTPSLEARNFTATYPPHTSLNSLLQRWIC